MTDKADRTTTRFRHSLNATLDQFVAALRVSGTHLIGLLLLLGGLAVLFASLLPGTFLRVATVQSMMFQLPELGLLSLAMAIPLVSGGLNLAIIATANQAALLMAWILTTQMPHDAGGGVLALWIATALVAGFLLCLAIGILTGVIIAAIGVHPILVTLGTQTLINGISIWLTRGRTLSGFPEPLLIVSNGTFLEIPISFIVLMVMSMAVHILLTRTPLGIRIHMIGSNLEATRYSGVDTRRVQIWVYVLSSLLCWLAAIVMMARFNSAGANIAQSYLLITILAAILGGIDPYGGFGRIGGLVVSLAILQMISSGFNLLGFSEHLTLALWGLTLLAVMAVKRVASTIHFRPRTDPAQSNAATLNSNPEKVE
jgi:simple sugar transport system permease protein